jgi:DNA-binding transcriptional regulator YdaS (Cro superfamily)
MPPRQKPRPSLRKSERIRRLLRRAITHAGGQESLAKRCGWSQQAISKALQTGIVSAELANGIHEATSGNVHRSSLRPDLWSQPEKVALSYTFD